MLGKAQKKHKSGVAYHSGVDMMTELSLRGFQLKGEAIRLLYSAGFTDCFVILHFQEG